MIDRITECRDNERYNATIHRSERSMLFEYRWTIFVSLFFFSFPPSSNIEFLFIVKRRESSFLQFVHRDAVSSDYLNYSVLFLPIASIASIVRILLTRLYVPFYLSPRTNYSLIRSTTERIPVERSRFCKIIRIIGIIKVIFFPIFSPLRNATINLENRD